MSASFSFRTQPPFRRLAKQLGEAGRELNDWRPAWRAFIPLVGPEMAATLRSRGAAIGETWPALSPAYAARKAAAGQGRAIGFLTGRMAAELSDGVARRSVTRRRLRWGPKLPRAYVFHHGHGQDQDANARPFLAYTARLRARLDEILTARADAVLARAMEGV